MKATVGAVQPATDLQDSGVCFNGVLARAIAFQIASKLFPVSSGQKRKEEKK
jgi:hypothetical protein